MKRGVDIAGGVVGCALLLLFLPVLGPLVWLDVGRPVFSGRSASDSRESGFGC